MIIPSIDLMNGKAVQLKQGKEKVLEREDVMELAGEFAKYGEIAVIDLDAALGKGDNSELVAALCKTVDCRVGGGIRTIERAQQVLGLGAKKIIIGTAASPQFLSQLPKERVIVAIDTKNSRVVNEGWTATTSKTPIEMVKELEGYCSEFLFTNVDREGLMQGIDLEAIKAIKNSTKNDLTVAGGITTFDDIKSIEEMGANSQVGMALYTNKIDLAESFIALLDFEKSGNMIPTIAQDEFGKVLMLAFSTKESLIRTFRTGKATYFSRSRKELWTKGETSGNFQQILKVRADCDSDALLFTVRQTNEACNTGSYSCFGGREFGIHELYSTVLDRIKNPQDSSYTSKLAQKEESIMEKIKEESEEVVNYRDKDNLVWEIADLTYFILVLMAKKGITVSDITNELWRRKK